MLKSETRKCSPLLLAFVGLWSVAACDGEKLTALDSGCQSLGVCANDEPLKPVVIDLLVDHSLGSTGTAEHVREALNPMLRFVAARTGQVRLWMLGVNGTALAPLGEQMAPKFTSRRGKGKARELESWLQSAENYFLVAAAPTFAAPPIKKSPLAEALSVVGLREAKHAERVIVLLSDARETGILNFECGELPTGEKWRKALDKRGALLSDALTGIEVRFAFFGMPTLRGCPADLNRQRDVKALWESALRRAGATVAFDSGAPVLGTSSKTGTHLAEVKP